MNHSKLTAAIAAAIASLACAGVATAETCAEKATRLKTQVDAQQTSDGQTRLSQVLGAAAAADETRCQEIMARLQERLQAAREGHASEDNPVPNQESGDAPAATGPSDEDATSDSAADEDTTGHASEDEPIPNEPASTDEDSDAESDD